MDISILHTAEELLKYQLEVLLWDNVPPELVKAFLKKEISETINCHWENLMHSGRDADLFHYRTWSYLDRNLDDLFNMDYYKMKYNYKQAKDKDYGLN